jgi:hypothetical protein
LLVTEFESGIGPAFQAELKGIVVDEFLFGDVGSFLKDVGVATYSAFSPSLSLQSKANLFLNAAESGVGVVSDKLGTAIDILKLLLVPETAQ